MFDLNMRGCFWSWLNILNIARIEKENSVGYDFTEDVGTFLISYFRIDIK